MKKHLGRRLLVAATAIAAMAVVAPLAQAATPAPGYSQFVGCPTAKENPKIEFCLYSKIKSGNFKMGNKNVPITNPITLTGGTDSESPDEVQ